MPSIGSLLPINPFRNSEENGPQLLELRTNSGAVYVCPSPWQRVRLQWTFRHFHVLAPEVLSRRDRHLIEKLSQSAVVTPSLPVAGNTVLGVVEEARSKFPASGFPASANRVVTPRAEPPARQPFRAPSPSSGLLSPYWSVGLKQTQKREVRDAGFQQWGALGTLAAVCVVVILASTYAMPRLRTEQEQMRNPPTLSTPTEHAANHIKPPDLHPAAPKRLPLSPVAVSVPNAAKPEHLVASSAPEPALVHPEPPSRQLISSLSASRPALPAPDRILVPAPVVPSTPPERRFVAEFPQGPFAHPVVSEPNLVGEVQLQALIGADGSVKDVTVLSGSPKLAEVGMRAVRQWHYNPYQVLGNPVEVETKIKMNFFGQDAVSIALSPTEAPASSSDSP
jgi:Gram-negative bacterial TonB protein C-terminal